MSGNIQISKNAIPELVRKAYDLSIPVGLGFLHAKTGSLTDEQVNSLINYDEKLCVVDMDYVLGRCCKFRVLRDKTDSTKFYIRDSWYDHSSSDFEKLLAVLDDYPLEDKVES